MTRLKNNIKIISLIYLLSISNIYAQKEIVEPINYGDMSHWMVRQIKESKIIGGQTKYLYEIVKGDTLKDVAYKNTVSPWAVSSVLAKVKGITKTSITVFPEKRDNDYCARLETRIEKCTVLGLFDINVLASGTIFLGEMLEPIKDTNNPQSKLVTGIPFTKHPKALQYDYKVTTGGNCIQSTGFSKQKKLDRKDMAEVQILLQNRWEDADGNIYAKRVATGWERFGQSVDSWQNNHRLELHYGDISTKSFYAEYMELKSGEQAYYTRNSKGKMVPIHEVTWALPNEKITHLILQFSSSNGGAYTGSTDSKFWIDNVKLVY
ncbi:PCMD domain-containing protein [Dysgonomonas sp. Marseille-P4677]|uniref:PCMD domain-containing protein n=1 Tax=Dysgonomonas sp. Marseille-P4677 TaxID=2364790 RepID=UPI001913EE53|nr:PCMD domain-containing protein [Dysgonomonas sp. Marseille-P4677]MBK5721676.1 PCMD domain-containing protein [Dysgonomonas sp. Marseille-P4677]